MPSAMIDRSARLATRKMTGISRTSPISKNIGRPMIAPIAAIDHGSIRWLDLPTIVSTIWSAPPESASSLPNIAPRAIRMPTPLTVSPTPVLKLPTTSSMLRPAIAPTVSEPRIRARNGCSLKNVISTTSTAIPTSAAVMSWPVPGDGLDRLGRCGGDERTGDHAVSSWERPARATNCVHDLGG